VNGVPESLGEFELIERFFTRHSTRADVLLGIGDDAALLHLPADTDLVAAVDTVVAGRHFPLDCTPRSIGHRVMAVNLSDLAAMGATPAWATLALTLPAADPVWLQEFADGLLSLASLHGVSLVGGDTTAGPLTVSVQILGHVARGTALRRSGAQEGDVLAVTGSLGDAGAGLAFATGRLLAPDRAAGEELIRRFDYPTPRVAFGAAARGIANAAMDLSDGLIGDLPKLAAASGLSAHVEVDWLPLSPALRALGWAERARDWALGAGDDYELLIAVPPHRFEDLTRVAARLDLMLTAIGELRRGNGVSWSLGGGAFTPIAQGYDHFL
jgi:thiamine-monophosphate kinase